MPLPTAVAPKPRSGAVRDKAFEDEAAPLTYIRGVGVDGRGGRFFHVATSVTARPEFGAEERRLPLRCANAGYAAWVYAATDAV